MALDAVVSEIREKGKKEAAIIVADGKAQADKLLSDANAKAAAIKSAAEEDAKRQSAQIIARETAAANLSVKRDFLNVEKDMLDQVYKATIDAIDALPEDFHKKAVKELCKVAAKELKEGVFYCNERDVKAVEDALASLKTLSEFKLAGTKNISGGVIAESKDGLMQLDFSYGAYLAEVWERGLKDASEALFK